jgi:Tfp pilus assembly protein PilN
MSAHNLSYELARIPEGERVTTIAAAKVDYTTGNLDAEAEVIAAFNTTNGKINDLIAALKARGILATA